MSGPRGIGRFYGIGVGPGDPELLTLKARRLLTEVPVIFVPQADEQSSGFAREIIADLVDEKRITGLTLPMVRNAGALAAGWGRAAETIWSCLERGLDGAMVNLGDPLLYGTFVHVMNALRSRHPEVEVTIVPGITSIAAAAGGALVPLAVNDEKIAILSGLEEDASLKDVLTSFDTVVFLKAARRFDRLLDLLEGLALVDKTVCVSRATAPGEEIVTDIRCLRGRKLDYFSLLIVRR